MEYNTTREALIISEYGRHIQKLVDYAVTIKDDDLRNRTAKTIIEMMLYMNPQFRNVEEYRQKMWDHLIIMSNYKLKVDSPYPLPTEKEKTEKPQPLGYPKKSPRFRHYGINVQNLIKKLKAIDKPEKKKEGSEILASYMKLVYRSLISGIIF